MPKYDYFCEANGRTVEVNHDVNTKLKTWGEVCFVAQISLNNTDALEPVRLSINAFVSVSSGVLNKEDDDSLPFINNNGENIFYP